MKKLKQTLTTAALGLLLFASGPAFAEENLPGLGVQEDAYFYTGKPYDADAETYAFMYRNYDPEINRWTAPDPSGFPDGANNHFYAPVPTAMIDLVGLATLEVYKQFFGRSWETLTTVTIEEDTSISLTGIDVAVGVSKSGPSGSITFGFEADTSSTVINQSANTTLVFEDQDPIPQGEDWTQVSYTTTSENTDTSKIAHNDPVGDNRYRSKWISRTSHVGYVRWERWVE